MEKSFDKQEESKENEKPRVKESQNILIFKYVILFVDVLNIAIV